MVGTSHSNKYSFCTSTSTRSNIYIYQEPDATFYHEYTGVSFKTRMFLKHFGTGRNWRDAQRCTARFSRLSTEIPHTWSMVSVELDWLPRELQLAKEQTKPTEHITLKLYTRRCHSWSAAAHLLAVKLGCDRLWRGTAPEQATKLPQRGDNYRVHSRMPTCLHVLCAFVKYWVLSFLYGISSNWHLEKEGAPGGALIIVLISAELDPIFGDVSLSLLCSSSVQIFSLISFSCLLFLSLAQSSQFGRCVLAYFSACFSSFLFLP